MLNQSDYQQLKQELLQQKSLNGDLIKENEQLKQENLSLRNLIQSANLDLETLQSSLFQISDQSIQVSPQKQQIFNSQTSLEQLEETEQLNQKSFSTNFQNQNQELLFQNAYCVDQFFTFGLSPLSNKKEVLFQKKNNNLILKNKKTDNEFAKNILKIWFEQDIGWSYVQNSKIDEAIQEQFQKSIVFTN